MLVRLLAPLGVTAPAVRTAISRMVRQEWLRPVRLEAGPGYALTDQARARLDEAPDRPTLIALHHPPFDTGIPWLTEDPDALWVGRLREIVEGRRHIVALVSGHVHRPIFTSWSGIPLMVCPSTAPQVALGLAPIDPDRPDERPMIVADPPAFALHHWDGRRLASHFDTAEDHEILARYTPKLQSLVNMLVREKEGSTLLDLG